MPLKYAQTYEVFNTSKSSYQGALKKLLLPNSQYRNAVSLTISDVVGDSLIGRHSAAGLANVTTAGGFNDVPVNNIPPIIESQKIDSHLANQVYQNHQYNAPNLDVLRQLKYEELGSMNRRTQDFMTSEAIIKKIVKDTDGNVIHTYVRDASSEIASQWSNANTNPADSIRQAVEAIYLNGGGTGKIGILFGANAMKLFVNNVHVSKAFDNRTFAQDNIWLPRLGENGIGVHGAISLPSVQDKVALMTYSNIYREFGADVKMPFIDTNSAIVFAIDNTSGVQWYGSCDVIINNTITHIVDEVVFDKFSDDNPVGEFHRAQSRYFPILANINQFPVITVS